MCGNPFHVCARVCVGRSAWPPGVQVRKVPANTAVGPQGRGPPRPHQGQAHWGPGTGTLPVWLSFVDVLPRGPLRSFSVSREHCLRERSGRCGCVQGPVGCCVRLVPPGGRGFGAWPQRTRLPLVSPRGLLSPVPFLSAVSGPGRSAVAEHVAGVLLTIGVGVRCAGLSPGSHACLLPLTFSSRASMGRASWLPCARGPSWCAVLRGG